MHLRSACMAALLAAGGWSVAQAAVLTTTTATPTTSGVSVLGAPSSSLNTYQYSYINEISDAVTHKTVTNVVTAPTSTTAGLALIYDVATTTRTTSYTDYKEDYFGWNVQLTDNSAGTEYLTLAGSFSSSVSTTLSLYLGSTGSYVGTSSPFGTVTPALPSYFLSLDGGTSWTSLSMYTATDSMNSSFSGSGSTSLSLLAGTTVNYLVAVYAGTGVDLSSVSLSAYTSSYGASTRSVVQELGSTTTLVNAAILSPIPEPDSYALMMAGLAAVGLRLRRRQST